MKKKFVSTIVVILVFGAGFGFGWALNRNKAPLIATPIQEKSGTYKFISPLLFLKTPEEDSFPKYRPMKDAITVFAENAIKVKKVESISIYFRNLNTSQWVGVNTTEKFSPASMLKVIKLIGAFKELETNPDFFSFKVNITAADESRNEMYFPPKNPVLAGRTYTVKELLEHLIIESDNVANSILGQVIGKEKMDNIYRDLELELPTSSEDPTYTTQEYSRIFRTLYNSTYLSRTSSEKVLELLSKTTYTQGLVAGLPSGTTVAHKYGTRVNTSLEGNQLNELHDCGIVYHEKSPYFLCVMTRGSDLKDLEKVLQDASKLVWEQVEKTN